MSVDAAQRWITHVTGGRGRACAQSWRYEVASSGMSDFTAAELRVTGGSWHGLLFENPTANYPTSLTWSFTIDFEEMDRDYGTVTPSLTVEWVPATGASWDSLAGQRYVATSFANPIESSVYFFQHYRFDRVELSVERQSQQALGVKVRLQGDLDGLGVTVLNVDAQLSFDGIYVQTDSTGSDVDAATELLARFTDVARLVPQARANNVHFATSG